MERKRGRGGMGGATEGRVFGEGCQSLILHPLKDTARKNPKEERNKRDAYLYLF